MNRTVLLVDDDRGFSNVAAAALRREGFDVQVAHSLFEARQALARSEPAVVVLDRRLPDGDGLELLPDARRRAPSAQVLVVTAHADIPGAVDAMRSGAADYVTKPVEIAELIHKARRAVEGLVLRDRLARAESELGKRHRLIEPRSPSMRAVLDQLERIARSPRSSVLLLGETGSGKEVLARHLHALSFPEGDGPFVHVNCATLPESTVESELFGHERGAFTDAKAARPGLVEQAHGGTLLLDEIGELPLPLQAKLLTWLDSGRFRRLGGTNERTSDARVIAATHRDLHQAAREGQFREDLLFRLNVFRIDIPPLRERREDLHVLADGLLARLSAELGLRGREFSERAQGRLSRYAFPGNVRELRNVIERALVLEPGPLLDLDSLDAGPAASPVESPDVFRVADGPITLAELEQRYTRHVLEMLGGKRMEAARALGVSYPTFLKRLGEPVDDDPVGHDRG